MDTNINTMYLTLVFCLGTYVLANMGFRVALAYLCSKEQEEISLSLANMSLRTMPLVDQDFIDSFPMGLGGWDFLYTDMDLDASIAAYEEEMDQEWEDEIMGYAFIDIAVEMALTLEDDPYEDLPFTASMRRSAKTNKRINFVLNCEAERSVHHANAKAHK